MRPDAKQAHRRLAAFIGLFLAVHFAAHFAALRGIAAQDVALQWGRSVYQIPILEAVLVLALSAQIMLGIKLLRRIAKRKRKDFWHWTQFASGTYLAFFVVMHTSAAVGTRVLVGLETNFYWAAGTLVLEPLKFGFAPYYVLAVSALAGHVVAALHFHKPMRWHAPALAIGPLAGLVIILAYGGAFYAIELPQEHRDYFGAFPGISD
ncbi:MAG: hypothetical protein AAGK01_07950 [Pseudomonadota bacterium]